MNSLDKKSILEILSFHSNELSNYRVKYIGLLEDEFTTYKVNLIVILELNKKAFNNFMSLLHFIESILDQEVNLFAQYFKRNGIEWQMLNEVEYIPISNSDRIETSV